MESRAPGELLRRSAGQKQGQAISGGIVAQAMSTTRLEKLKEMVAQNPADSFLRYGLAMEHRNAGDLESALAEFRVLIAGNPDYSAAFFQGGQTLERLGRVDEARDFYTKGIEVTTRKGETHARNEMQAALDLLG
jgi:Flp pilus assembly protein TadD